MKIPVWAMVPAVPLRHQVEISLMGLYDRMHTAYFKECHAWSFWIIFDILGSSDAMS